MRETTRCAKLEGRTGRRRARSCVVVVSLLCAWPAGGALASAQTPAEAPPSGTPGDAAPAASRPLEGQALSYGDVDAAVVRIFSLGNVETRRLQGRVVARDIALPSGGHGSGLLVSSSGLVVTAKHVIEDSHVVVVRIPGDPRVYPAVVVFTDPDHDVAVLRIPHGDYAIVPLPTGAVPLRVRQTVDAIGYPLDPTRVQPQSSRGIIAGLLPDGELQLDMSVNPGNSGGPLMDEDGHIVGIVVARGRLDQGVEGIAVAEPLPVVQAALAQAAAPDWSAAVAAPGVPRLVDLLIRMGPLGAIHDVVDDLDQPARRIRQLERVVAPVQDADLMVVAAAYLWDAAMVVLESQDGSPEPRHVRDPRARARALALMHEARALAARALAADPSVAERSPFAQQIQTGGASRALAHAGAGTAPVSPFPRGAASDPERAWRYIPLLVMGAAYDTGGIHGPTGGGTVLQPLFTGAYSAPVRAVLFVGTSSQYGRGPDEETFFIAGELGVGVRLGYPVGLFLGVSWMPSVLRYLAPYHTTPIFGPRTTPVDTDGTLVTAAGGSLKVGLDFYHFVILGQLAVLKGNSAVPGFTNWSVAIGHGF